MFSPLPYTLESDVIKIIFLVILARGYKYGRQQMAYNGGDDDYDDVNDEYSYGGGAAGGFTFGGYSLGGGRVTRGGGKFLSNHITLTLISCIT